MRPYEPNSLYLSTASSAYTKARPVANSEDSSYPARVPTKTVPSGDGVVTLPHNQLSFVFYGEGADNATYSARIIGWRLAGDLWIPVNLAEVDVVLSAVVGAADSAVGTSERFADELDVTSGHDAHVVHSPENDTVAFLTVDTLGSKKIEVVFNLGTATAANVLVAAL